MDKNILDSLNNIPIPGIANGTVLPRGIEIQIMKEEERQRQLEIMKEQLSLYSNELKSAKKDLFFSRISTVIAILISIAAIVVPLLL